jgi:hypothetical protein
MPDDIRDKPFIHHDDVIALNFINGSMPYVFRRHFRQGLRSHVLEILKPADLELEKTGIEKGALRWFPKAKPYKIFRIFRTKLKTLANALQEINRVKIVEKYLFPDYLARSNELIVDYLGSQGPDLMLCGLQEYVDGEILDPWSVLDQNSLLPTMHDNLNGNADTRTNNSAIMKNKWVRDAREKGCLFIEKVKQMIFETHHIPDLAGVGNLIMVGSGAIKLVDINNIGKVTYDSNIALDDRGYPVCDKSIEALSLLEMKLLGRKINREEPIYRVFLDPERQKEANRQADFFYKKIKSSNKESLAVICAAGN